MTGRAGNGVTDVTGLGRRNPADAYFTLRDAEQPQCPRKRQHSEDHAHREQAKGSLNGAGLLDARQGNEADERSGHASLTTSCAAMRPSSA
jgi:hypothetical protein